MLWMLPLALAVVGTAVLVVLALRMRREIPPTGRVFDAFGRELRPVLVRVRDETARARRRIPD